jgi:hypothetical protein
VRKTAEASRGSGNTRIAHPAFARKICSAEDAAATVRREIDGIEVEMAFWLIRAQRRTLT